MHTMEVDLGGVELSPFAALIVIVLNAVFLYCCENDAAGVRSPCSLPNCARCSGETRLVEQITGRLSLLIRETNEPNEKWAWRLKNLINSSNNKILILSEVCRASGYKPDAFIDTCSPVVWTLPGLRRSSWWHQSDHSDLISAFTSLENKITIRSVHEEYINIVHLKENWLLNETPAGKWRVFQIYNQGKKIKQNSRLCPVTTSTIESLCGFLAGNLFCYAMFSVLEPGSVIEPHTGPCNYRLRCHLPLEAPPGFHIQVGNDTLEWKAGKLVVFDDSLIHRVWHSGTEESNASRVVLIFDVWHPDVDPLERLALNTMFPSLIA